MENQSLPPWAQNLTSHRHECGQFVYVGRHTNGSREWPVFQLAPGIAVLCCPTCEVRLSLDHCKEIGEPREEEELCLNEC